MLRAEDKGFENARKVWNEMIDCKPALNVRCLGSADVIQTVNFAREHDMLVVMKGGGHNVTGNAVGNGGMMIDLSGIYAVQFERENKTVRVEGGCLLSEVDVETQNSGLAVSAGIVSHTGVAGLTPGGDFGCISRKYGLAIDNLFSATGVTADGTGLTAGREETPDVFRDLRGGGGNFGVVTSFEFQYADIGTEVFSGVGIYPFDDAKKYLQFHREYVPTLPDEMTVWLVIRLALPFPFLPESVHGKLVIIVPFVYLGKAEKGKELMNPIRQFGNPHGEAMGMHPWGGWQAGFDELMAHGAGNYWKSHHLQEFPDACIDRVIEFADKFPTPNCEVFIPLMEDAPARVPETDTACAFRNPPFILNIHTRWNDAKDDERSIGWPGDFFENTRPFAQGVYVNFLSDEGEARVKEAYSPAVWQRLVQLKNKYDPNNFFKLNQNIKPSLLQQIDRLEMKLLKARQRRGSTALVQPPVIF